MCTGSTLFIHIRMRTSRLAFLLIFCAVERTEILSVPAVKADAYALQDARLTPVSISMADSLAVCRIAVSPQGSARIRHGWASIDS